MCGIVGFSGRIDLQMLRRMNETLIHRGPDDEGYYADGCMNLAMRRLSIVDLAAGQQPMSNEDGSVQVICNGEIYNHRGIRKELEKRGHRFGSDHSDTEVIPHLYEEDGENWVLRANGMFGAAVWDATRKRLLLYRDRIGKKPLYYALAGEQILFASEIKAILRHPLVSPKLDFEALYHYFGMKHISAPRTAYLQVRQLLPGHLLIWQDGRIHTRPYWQIDFGHTLKGISEEAAAEHLLELLHDAVRIRMECDVPYGAYLSGGIDSSSVVSIMSQMQERPVETFCLGYHDKPEGQFLGKSQDLAYAREMSGHLGTRHHEYIIDAQEFAHAMPAVLACFDEPFSGVVSTYFISTLIKKHVKVALSGDGADELFGSYLAHRLAFPIENYLSLSRRGKQLWEDLDEEDRTSLRPFDTPDEFLFLKRTASSSLAEWRSRLSVFSSEERGELLSQEFLEAAGHLTQQEIYRLVESDLTGGDALNRILEIDQKELLPNEVLPFVDRLSMAHSIEVRVPYLDYQIIEFSNRLPGNMKIHKGITKYVHKKAMERLLPKKLVHRPKEGFVQPIYSWMHGPLKDWVTGELDALPREIFNPQHVQQLKQTFLSRDQRVNAKVWNLLCFGLWYKERNVR